METRETLYKEWMSQFDKDNPPSMRAAFNAGMDAASTPWRTEWHDLEKNPNDLPKTAGCFSDTVLVALKYGHLIVTHTALWTTINGKGEWRYDGKGEWRCDNKANNTGLIDKSRVVAWMELPEWKGGTV